MHRVAVLVLPGVVLFDLAVPVQVFGHPDERARYRVTVCGAAPGPLSAGPASADSGVELVAAAGLEALVVADTVVVPGYVPHDDPPQPVLVALRACAARGARLVSVCTGAFALAAAGLLDGRRAATHWSDAAELAARFPAVRVDPDVLYVDDGAVLTSAGIAAGIDLCLHVVRCDHGESIAAAVARRMVVAPHRTGGQAQYLQRPAPAPGSGLAATSAWAVDHLSDPISVADLARHAGWAPRTFARRFLDETGLPPHRWLTQQRLLLARELLETTEATVDGVAARSGLGSAANLRVLFARDAATTPSAYRLAYRGGHASGPVVAAQGEGRSRKAVDEPEPGHRGGPR